MARFSQEKEQDILEKYKSGMSTLQIAKIHGTYNTSIRRVLIRHGVTIRSYSEAQPKKVTSNPFEDLSNFDVQYWLGYLASDGNIGHQRNRINISTNLDPEHLKKYVAFLNVDIKIGKYFNKKYSCWEYSVNFNNPDVKKFLESLGITSRKSLTLKLNIPLTFNFIRGYLDGNGYVKPTPDGFADVEISTGSQGFAIQLQNFLLEQGIHCTVGFRHTCYIVGIYSTEAVKSLYSHLYLDTFLFLKRKEEKFGSSIRKLIDVNSPNSVEGCVPNTELAS